MKLSVARPHVISFFSVGLGVAAATSCASGGTGGAGSSASSAGIGGASSGTFSGTSTGLASSSVATGAGGATGTGGSAGTGGATSGCQGCVTTANCGAGRDCAQFAGDTYCATDCTSGVPCPSGYACTPVNSAEGMPVRVCIPVTNPCGGSMTTSSSSTSASSTSSTSSTTSASSSSTSASSTTSASSSSTSASSTTSASSSGSGTCAHSICVAGAKLMSGCDPCATQVCAGDAYCCKTMWDSQCVGEVTSVCGESCSGSSSSSSSTSSTSSTSSSSTSSSTSSTSSSTSSSSSSGSIGPGGGTLSALSFAIVGDTRPANEDDPAGYPTAVITKIWQDIEAASPKPAFAITTGDYMFASPSHTPGTQATQMGYYMTARAAFSNIMFPAMGNHECDGATADNCYACGSACNNVGGSCIGGVCETPNFTVFASNMLAPINQTLPYYTININGTGNAWTAKFVFVACNAWSPTQATWLGQQLSTSTTYTFVVRHEGTIANTAPCLSGTGSNNADTIMGQHPYTLLIAGHTHTYAYYSSEKQVIVGNGGAPLSGSIDYGYVIARQQGSSIVFTEYDYATNAVSNTFTVP